MSFLLGSQQRCHKVVNSMSADAERRHSLVIAVTPTKQIPKPTPLIVGAHR